MASQPGVEGQRLAVVAYFPVIDIALWKQTTANADIPTYISTVCEPGGTASRSPRLQAASIAAPVLLIHGDIDTRVPTDQSRLMLAALQSAGRQGTLLLVPGAEHGFTADQEAFAKPTADRFLAERLQ